MNQYIEGIVENIERRGMTKTIQIEFQDKKRGKDVIFFEEFVSIRDENGKLHYVSVYDDCVVSVGDEVFLFKNCENIAVEIYKEKEKIQEVINMPMNNKDILKRQIKDIDNIVSCSFVILAFSAINGAIVFLLGALFCYLFDSINNFINNSGYQDTIANGIFTFSFLSGLLVFIYFWRGFASNERQEMSKIKKMVADFRKSQAKQSVEVNKENKVAAR